MINALIISVINNTSHSNHNLSHYVISYSWKATIFAFYYVAFPLHWNQVSVIINGTIEQLYALVKEISTKFTMGPLSKAWRVWIISKHLFLLHLCWPQWSSLMMPSINHQWYTIGYRLSTLWFYQFISQHLRYKLQSLKFIIANGITADTSVDLHTDLMQTDVWISADQSRLIGWRSKDIFMQKKKK